MVRARWFRVPAAMARSFPKGSEVALAGAVRTATDGTRELRPAVGRHGGAGGARRRRARPAAALRPRSRGQGAGARADARRRAGPPRRGDDFDLVPAATRQRLALPTLAEALTRVHAPSDEDGGPAWTRWRRRDAGWPSRPPWWRSWRFSCGARRRRRARSSSRRTVAAAMRARVEEALAFALTATQARALDEIAVDLAGARPMRRLLVGDVGSGKTAVAFGAAALVAAAGALTLMMVPTEVLAEQQLRALGPLGARPGDRARRADRRDAGRRPRRNPRGLRAWTRPAPHRHAGVARRRGRAAAARPGDRRRAAPLRRRPARRAWSCGASASQSPTPHLLSMSATPIPRSLALALHGDLDASFLTERPGGRPPPTAIVCGTDDERRAAYARLRDALAEGNQAFVVCPVRQEARRPGAVTAVAQHARLRRALAPARVGLLHGALDAAAKEEALRAFADGRTDVLVATTVVELGIDVPNATVMIVEEADRLGLAQLHQLRGRVGRGARAGICFLFASEGLPAGRPGAGPPRALRVARRRVPSGRGRSGGAGVRRSVGDRAGRGGRRGRRAGRGESGGIRRADRARAPRGRSTAGGRSRAGRSGARAGWRGRHARARRRCSPARPDDRPSAGQPGFARRQPPGASRGMRTSRWRARWNASMPSRRSSAGSAGSRLQRPFASSCSPPA